MEKTPACHLLRVEGRGRAQRGGALEGWRAHPVLATPSLHTLTPSTSLKHTATMDAYRPPPPPHLLLHLTLRSECSTLPQWRCSIARATLQAVSSTAL
jgi:hypothetical protein